MAKSLRGELHAHGCVRCHTRYTDACEDLTTDQLCVTCRGGLPWTVMINSAAPKTCCRNAPRLVTKDEKQTYRLAGKRLWFICKRCSRTHPFDPRKMP